MKSHKSKFSSTGYTPLLTAVLLVGVSVSVGCSASLPTAVRHAPGGIDIAQVPGWSAASHRAVEPFGVAQNVRPGITTTPNIDAYLEPEVAAKQIVAKAAPRLAKAPVVPSATKPLETLMVEATVTTPSPSIALIDQPEPNADTGRYAARDRDSQKQQTFRGGDTLVITAGTIVLVLFILLLVLLVT